MWEDFLNYLLFDKKIADKRQNIWTYKSRFAGIAGYFSDKPWTRRNFNSFIASQKEKGNSNATLNKFVSVGCLVDKFFKAGELKEYEYFRESRSINRETLSPDEIKKLAFVKVWYKKKRKFLNKRQRCLILFFGQTGCRSGEVLSLRWENVHDDYVRFIDTKNSESRDVPVGKEMRQMLEDVMPVWKSPDTLVFQSARGGVLGNSQINLDLKARAKLCGITKPVSCHLFRHSFITTCLQEGMDWFTLSFIVGHKSPETTRAYSHNLLGFYKDQLFSHHPLLRRQMTFEMLRERIKALLLPLVDTQKFKLQIQEDKDSFMLKIDAF